MGPGVRFRRRSGSRTVDPKEEPSRPVGRRAGTTTAAGEGRASGHHEGSDEDTLCRTSDDADPEGDGGRRRQRRPQTPLEPSMTADGAPTSERGGRIERGNREGPGRCARRTPRYLDLGSLRAFPYGLSVVTRGRSGGPLPVGSRGVECSTRDGGVLCAQIHNIYNILKYVI